MNTPRQHLSGCETQFLAISKRNNNTIRYKVFPARCHSWNCPVCAREKANNYRKRMRPLFDGRLLWMYTFTYYHSKPALEVWREYSIAWNRLRTAAVKKFGKFSYARVLEHHKKSNYPHLHLIADRELTAVWLAAELRSAGFGYQCVCKPVTTEGACYYVTKYLSKPWTSKVCQNYRKDLKLRIISFGGNACDRRRPQDAWNLVARGSNGADCSDSVDRDLAWDQPAGAKLIYRSVIDATVEETYLFSDEPVSWEVITHALSP
jgi:hypothetical protein